MSNSAIGAFLAFVDVEIEDCKDEKYRLKEKRARLEGLRDALMAAQTGQSPAPASFSSSSSSWRWACTAELTSANKRTDATNTFVNFIVVNTWNYLHAQSINELSLSFYNQLYTTTMKWKGSKNSLRSYTYYLKLEILVDIVVYTSVTLFSIFFSVVVGFLFVFWWLWWNWWSLSMLFLSILSFFIINSYCGTAIILILIPALPFFFLLSSYSSSEATCWSSIV